jgi:hypothetical protein
LAALAALLATLLAALEIRGRVPTPMGPGMGLIFHSWVRGG